jgi:hypothetical protein
MNFGKLLATGRSIINGRRGLAYKENPHVYLPKFEPVKNPFVRAGTTTAPAPADARKPQVETARALPRATPWLTPAKAPAPTLPTANWAAKLNPIAMFRGNSGAAAHSPAAVQTELSLETVKVIENDLRGEEVEVVPLKSRPARKPPGKGGEPAEVWDDLGAKIFGANAV